MPGGLMQLVAYGAQDIYLTGNPQFTYWKISYRRHTNYSSEYVHQNFEIAPSFTPLQQSLISCKIERVGDLLHDCYFVIDLPTIYGDVRSCFQWHSYLGYNIIQWSKLLIGGQEIDKQYSEWMLIWNELTLSSEKKRNWDDLIGNSAKFKIFNRTAFQDDSQPEVLPTFNDDVILYRKNRLYVPLMFWFCRNPGLALPLIALQYVEVFIQMEINPTNDWFKIGSVGLSPAEFFSVTIGSEEETKLYNIEDRRFRLKMDANGINANNIWYYFINPGISTNVNGWNENCYIDCNFIYLDDDERRRFAKATHEFLITQTQRRVYDGLKSGINRVRIEIQHPVKELFWIYSKVSLAQAANERFNYTMLNKPEIYNYYYDAIENNINIINYTPGGRILGADNVSRLFVNSYFVNRLSQTMDLVNPTIVNNNTNITDDFLNIFQGGKFLFNGTDRQEYKDLKFYSDLQFYKYHTNSPRIPGIYTWSFSLYPEKEQPSGTCNFSRLNKVEFEFNLKTHLDIDDIETYNGLFSMYNSYPIPDSAPPLIDPQRSITFDPNIRDYEMRLYAFNYNILRIIGGTADIAFSN